jgi:hypothetical protein
MLPGPYRRTSHVAEKGYDSELTRIQYRFELHLSRINCHKSPSTFHYPYRFTSAFGTFPLPIHLQVIVLNNSTVYYLDSPA